jgi:hypothetical protein
MHKSNQPASAWHDDSAARVAWIEHGVLVLRFVGLLVAGDESWRE